MLRKVTSFALLAVFLCNGAGFYSVFQFQKEKNSNNFTHNHYRRQDLLTVRLPVNSSLEDQGFERLHKKEYRYEGHRYDEIRREKKSDIVTVHLSHDSYEEELISFLQSFFNSGTHSNQQKRAASNVRKRMIKGFLTSPVNTFCNSLLERNRYPLKNKTVPATPYLEVASPPPKQA